MCGIGTFVRSSEFDTLARSSDGISHVHAPPARRNFPETHAPSRSAALLSRRPGASVPPCSSRSSQHLGLFLRRSPIKVVKSAGGVAAAAAACGACAASSSGSASRTQRHFFFWGCKEGVSWIDELSALRFVIMYKRSLGSSTALICCVYWTETSTRLQLLFDLYGHNLQRSATVCPEDRTTTSDSIFQKGKYNIEHQV